MKIQHLIILLAFSLFSQQSWAPPIKGGATGGAEAAPDISKCDLNPSQQTKMKIKGRDGKVHIICTGQIICEGKSAPISCKISKEEPCPKANECKRLKPEDVDPSIPFKLTINYREAVSKYWTKERINAAEPTPILIKEENTPEKIDKNIINKILAEPVNINDFEGGNSPGGIGTDVTDELYGANPFFYPMGQLLSKVFVDRRLGRYRDSYCSGALIMVGNKTFVVTAAHCLVKIPYIGSTYQGWLFSENAFIQSAGYVNEKQIRAKNVFLLTGFIPWIFDSKVHPDYDIALIELETSSDLKCCFGLITSNLAPPGVTLGYPRVAPFPKNGRMYYVKIENFLDDNSIKNNMTDGSSGGPWIGHYLRGGKYGYISGVNSHRLRTDPPSIMRSPKFWYLIENLIKCSNKEIPCEEAPVNDWE